MPAQRETHPKHVATYSATFVLWKFSAIRLSESYISHEPGMHTQLVAILKGVDTRPIYVTSIDSFGTASQTWQQHTRIAQPTSTGAYNCNDHCELQDFGYDPNTLSA